MKRFVGAFIVVGILAVVVAFFVDMIGSWI